MSLDIERIELKYRINETRALALQSRLAHCLQWDMHNGDGGYLVRSLYFDTLRDTDYEEKINGCDPRKKIRLRIYAPADQTAKLELKEKQRGRQRKQSLLLSRDAARELISGRYEALRDSSEPLALRLYLLMRTQVYVPKCIVQYRRLAYREEHNEIRLTFDSEIRATEANFDLFAPELPLYPVDGSGKVILEVKYNRFLFSEIKRALGDTLSLEEAVSKYCMARRISKHRRI